MINSTKLLVLLCTILMFPPALVAQETVPNNDTVVYSMMLPWPGAGTMIMAFASGCDGCTHFYFELDVKTASGSESLRRMVPKQPNKAPTWVYWMVDGEPPAVRIRKTKVANVRGFVEEGNGLDN